MFGLIITILWSQIFLGAHIFPTPATNFSHVSFSSPRKAKRGVWDMLSPKLDTPNFIYFVNISIF